jgi:pyruvyl transferase EpsO
MHDTFHPHPASPSMSGAQHGAAVLTNRRPATDAAQPLRRLREQADAVYDAVLPKGGLFALLDFPNHSNCGDSAIWLGERALLRRRGAHVAYACTTESYSERVLRTTLPHATVLLHGGGNFGSLWPNHHALRLQVLETLRDYKVIQLPQSLHFDAADGENFDRTARAIARHPDFTLLVRDHNSLAIGERLGARTLLCPDSAHYLDLARSTAAQLDCFVLARQDKEAKRSLGGDDSIAIGGSVGRADWLYEPPMPPLLERLATPMFRGAFRRPRAFQRLFQPLYLRYFDALAAQRVRRGADLLCRGRVVLTDRLHAHILSSLMEIPNVVLDNSYGKVHDYIRCWTSEHPGCYPVGGMEEARERVRFLLSRPEEAFAA